MKIYKNCHFFRFWSKNWFFHQFLIKKSMKIDDRKKCHFLTNFRRFLSVLRPSKKGPKNAPERILVKNGQKSEKKVENKRKKSFWFPVILDHFSLDLGGGLGIAIFAHFWGSKNGQKSTIFGPKKVVQKTTFLDAKTPPQKNLDFWPKIDDFWGTKNESSNFCQKSWFLSKIVDFW